MGGVRRRRVSGGVPVRIAASAVLAAVAMAGCDSIKVDNPSSSSTSSASSSTSTGAATTSSPSPSSAFGRDVDIPADGVGVVTTADLDVWTMQNKGDDIFAEFYSVPGSAGLAEAEQTAVLGWLAAYREAAASDSPSTAAAASPSETPSGPSSGAGSGSGSESGAGAGSGSVSGEPSASMSASVTASPTTSAAAQDEGLRVVPQLLAVTGQVVGVRLYGRYAGADHYTTIWYERAGQRVVDGTALFAEPANGAPDPVGRIRQLAQAITAAASPGSDPISGLSDRDLLGSAAFTTTGDLVIYLDPTPVSPNSTRVTIAAADVEPLLSDLGKEALAAAKSATIPGSPTSATGAGTGSGSSSGAGSSTATPTSSTATPSPTS